jgi:O-antigen ligase
VFYFLTIICVLEFIVDAYRNPLNWVESLFQLRRITLFLLILVALTILFHTSDAYEVSPGAGVRTIGGSVASLSLISPIISIVSAYSFLYRLEPRGRALFLFSVGLGGELISRSRFSQAALFLCLLLAFLPWVWNASRRRAYARITGFMTFAALACAAVGIIGRERIWTIFNKGQSSKTIESLSGRTEIWAFVFKYCLAHPQGMGYVAGFRIVFRQYFSLNSGNSLSQLGTAHNTYVDVLAGAGWLALGIYLIMLAKIVKLAWRFGKKQNRLSSGIDQSFPHGIGCSLLLLTFCLFYGMGATEFSAPLRGSFGILYTIIAIILGALANAIAASRQYIPASSST